MHRHHWGKKRACAHGPVGRQGLQGVV
jgi:hypothetical protein